MMTWQANANFRLALRAQKCGNYKRAREMYLRVLKDAPDHAPTLHNLAVLELRGRRYKQSLQLLEKVSQNRDAKRQTTYAHWSQLVDKVRVPKNRDVKRQIKHWSEFDYSLYYNEALAHTLQAQQDGQIDAVLAQEALKVARKLVQQLLTRLVDHDWPSVRRPSARRHRKSPDHDNELLMLQKIELAAITLLADIVLQANNTPHVWEAAARETLKDSDARATLDTAKIAEARRQLRDELPAPELPLPATWASTAERYVRAHPRTNARAYYNLACYRGRILQALNRLSKNKDLREQLRKHALNDLESALVDESLIGVGKERPGARGRPQLRWLGAIFDVAAELPRRRAPVHGEPVQRTWLKAPLHRPFRRAETAARAGPSARRRPSAAAATETAP